MQCTSVEISLDYIYTIMLLLYKLAYLFIFYSLLLIFLLSHSLLFPKFLIDVRITYRDCSVLEMSCIFLGIPLLSNSNKYLYDFDSNSGLPRNFEMI